MNNSMFLIVVGLDIAGYTNRSINLQLSAQQNLEEWVVKSAKDAEVGENPDDLRWLDTGDGGYLLIETHLPKPIRFLERFYNRLGRFNAQANEESQIFVRAAVHCADAVEWQESMGTKYAGNAVNVCARILDGMNRDHQGQVVCSGGYLRRVNVADENVEEFRLPDFTDKHGIQHETWNISKIPGFGITPPAEYLHSDQTKWKLN